VISSNTIFIAYRSKEYGFFKPLSNTLFIETFIIENCICSEDVFANIGLVLSTKMKHIKRITLSECYLCNDHTHQELVDDFHYQEFSKLLFHDTAVIHYLKKLDISHNNITSSCVNTIIASLQKCIIEKLVISNTELNKEIVNLIFVVGCHGGSQILNFIRGVPLIIINTVQENDSLTNYFTAFVSKCIVNDHYINVFSDISNYVYYYNIFLLNSGIQRESIKYAVSSLQQLICKVEKLMLFGIDLTDDMAFAIKNCLHKVFEITVNYFLLTGTKLITNLSEIPSQRISELMDIVGCNEEMFTMYCKSMFCEGGHLTELDISAYQLTSTSTY